MRRFILTGLLLIGIFVPCRAGSLDPTVALRIQDLTLGGLQHAYNFDFPGAHKLFDEAIAAEPLHPRPYVGKAALTLWSYLLGKKTSDYDSFFTLADKTIDVCEAYIDRFGEDPDVLTCLGTIYGYRAFVRGRAKSYIKSAWDGRKSYDYFSDALKLDEHAYDAYLGLGVFHYFSEFLPKPLQWIVSILGISGDSRLGMKELRLAAEKGVYTKTEARYYLAQFLPWTDNDFETSENILTDLSRQYPSNTLLSFTIAVWKIRRHDVASAKEQLLSVIEHDNNAVEGVILFARYKLAECYFRLGDFDRAREFYQLFLADHQDDTYSATANYRTGLCFEITGQREQAVTYYRRALASDRTFGDDAYSSRKAELQLTSPLSYLELTLLKAQNAFRSGAYQDAITIFSQLKNESVASSDVHAEAVYGLGETSFEMHLYTEALQYFRALTSSKIANEHWLLPWAHYQSGLSYLKLSDTVSARKEFEYALDYDDYDFKNWLQFRSERELDKLKK